MKRGKLVSQGIVFFAVTTFLTGGCSRSVDDLIGDLGSERMTVRMKAATTLSRDTGTETTAKLIAQFDKNDERMTFIVCQVLGNRADTTAIPALGRMAGHANPYIRGKALWSIGNIGGLSGKPYLIKGLQDSIPSVRQAAVQGVGLLYDSTAPTLLYPMLRDPVDSVRTAAVLSLYNLRAIKAANVLAADFASAATDSSPLVRYVAVQALGGGFPDTTVAGELLLEALHDETMSVRLESIASLAKISYTEAVPVLKRVYDDASVDEESAISDAIKTISGEIYPPATAK